MDGFGPDYGLLPPDSLLAPLDLESAPAPDDVAAFLAAPQPQTGDLVAYDQWGLTQIPTASGLPFSPVFPGWVAPVAPSNIPTPDACIAVILDFLATFLVTDKNAVAACAAVMPGVAPVVRVFPHNPGEIAFSSQYAPALFMWRDGEAQQEYIADDWLMDITPVKALWVYPPALQDNQRARSTVGHVIAKLVVAAIERGRTPGWTQPGDPDTQASTYGSLFYTFAGFEALLPGRGRPGVLRIAGVDGTVVDTFPAHEMSFTLREKLDVGLGRFPELVGAFDTISNPAGEVVDAGFLDH